MNFYAESGIADDGREIWYRGGPPKEVIREIQRRTEVDSRGRRFYRDEKGAWRGLRTAADFADLNRLIDRVRGVVQ